MLRLPVTEIDGKYLYLPIATSVGVSLASHLLAAGSSGEQDLTSLLVVEPSLVAWWALHSSSTITEETELAHVSGELLELLRQAEAPWLVVPLGKKSTSWQTVRRNLQKTKGNPSAVMDYLLANLSKLLETRPFASKTSNGSKHKPSGRETDKTTSAVADLLTQFGKKSSSLSQKTDRNDSFEVSPSPFDRSDKLQALYNLAYGLSHEINNPLANISLRAQTLQASEADPDRRQKLAVIQVQAERAHAMMADLMLYAQPPRLHLEPLSVASLLQSVEQQMQPEAHRLGVLLSVDLQLGGNADCTIQGDSVQLRTALAALVVNALEASPTGKTVTLGACVQENSLTLFVQDEGKGIAANLLPQLFDPFYSGREAGRGLGLGLSKCLRIVELHAGTILVSQTSCGNTQFAISLPLSEFSK